jgi:excisionase family DNA binding protein
MERDIHLLNSVQVATFLGISVRTVCLWAECSELPAYKVGRRWLFRRDAIMNWLEQSRSHLPENRVERPASPAVNAATAAYSFAKTRL